MDLNVSAFQEPRGVMRIFQFIFAICAFATTTNYDGVVKLLCGDRIVEEYKYEYPFRLYKRFSYNCSNEMGTKEISGNFSSDAQFFVATGVLSMLFAIAVSAIYAKFDEQYKNNAQWPLIDFVLTVVFAILWLSGSAAWANGLTGLKMATSPVEVGAKPCNCRITSSNMSSLNISVILGFLNFFLWASDLWFLYKETEWFQQKQPAATGSPTM